MARITCTGLAAIEAATAEDAEGLNTMHTIPVYRNLDNGSMRLIGQLQHNLSAEQIAKRGVIEVRDMIDGIPSEARRVAFRTVWAVTIDRGDVLALCTDLSADQLSRINGYSPH